jgi:small subunit ribosomal protein S16
MRRIGAKGQPSYRIIATDKESPRDGRFLEILGFYNPRTQPATIQLNEDRIYEWMSHGAQPSESVERVLRSAGFFDRYERQKKGESVETLIAEAQAAQAARNVDNKTGSSTRPAKAKKPKSES